MKDQKKKPEHSVKRDVIQQMRDVAMEEMGHSLKDGMKKVEVMAPDSKHLSQGLDKAKKLVEQLPQQDPVRMDQADDDSTNEELRHGQMTQNEHLQPDDEDASYEEDMSPDELDAEINRLHELKAKKLSKQS